RRPAEPPLAKHWEEVLSSSPEVVVPTFRVMDELNLDLPDTAAIAALQPVMRSTFIAGGQHQLAGNEGFLRWVESTFTIPNIYLGPDRDPTYSCAPWVGLSGNQTSLQAGWYSYCYYSNGQVMRVFSPWWRWAPASPVFLTNFTVSPGDVLSVVVCLDLGSFVRARISMNNVTSKQATTFIVTAPSGSQLQADTVGWLMQADRFSSGRHLARMGAMYFDRTNAGLHAGPTLFHPTQPIYMTNEDGSKDIAYANIRSESLVEIGYSGL
ncbi:MAG: G1 family glutamic endopeptidase, partial [Dehalococcoidia bacterium]